MPLTSVFTSYCNSKMETVKWSVGDSSTMLDCGHHGNIFVQSPTGLLTKARQQFK